jgi:hypothetical protein
MSLRARSMLRISLAVAVPAAMLLASAGSLRYWQASVFIAEDFLSSLLAGVLSFWPPPPPPQTPQRGLVRAARQLPDPLSSGATGTEAHQPARQKAVPVGPPDSTARSAEPERRTGDSCWPDPSTHSGRNHTSSSDASRGPTKPGGARGSRPHPSNAVPR